ncbi:MAG: glycosyltransferase, partial [Nitrospira sp.]
VVATKAEMVESPFVEGVNVLWCPPKSPDEMAAAVLRVIDDPGLRLQLGEGARQLASSWFSWDAATDRTMSLLQGQSAVGLEEDRRLGEHQAV